ncbi:HsdM family class I SAM-dependent methyltransferase [Novipirellula rosea]|uniref:site-specific DNA-methyltransferase (adenine-specific) n=1 Tax=Novipirellula rosea TaxID=1031540 RepID=A0ABP8NEY9_9BACT
MIDNSSERLTKKELAKLHNDLWLNGGAPLAYVAWPTQVDILSCARGPDFWTDNERKYSPAFELEIASGIAKVLSDKRRFSANRLADGTFWDDPQNHSLADHDHAAHESLIQAIVETDADIGGESNPTLRRLLLLVVLIKYLEDREVFPGPGWFGHFHKGARNFLDVLKSGDPACVLRLLSNLESKFNGDVFSLPSESKLTARTLKQFAKLVEAKTLKKQRYLWDQFSFSHVPVEVISHLYQRFVQDSTAVYTPPFLAALLLDFAMPYHKLSGKERVLDPACGSGVFLVGAMRRLVNVWRSKNNWANPTVETLKSILREQVFGVERDPTAVDLTAFSLALAVCDSLQPNVIWNELRFDRLRNQNVFEDDFFNFASVGDDGDMPSLGQFDVVIGNPPFESEFSEPAIRVNKFHEKERGSIPDKQIAYLFLDEALRTVTDEGVVCLIQPSGFLYNLQSHLFRASLAQTGRLSTILDFTSIRGLYGSSGADPKTVAVLAGPESSKIRHLTFRRTYETTQRVAFEIDHYDRHQLTPLEVVENAKAARPNLLGGGRLGRLASRLSEMRTLGEVVNENGWLMAEGFISGKSGKKPGPHLTGQVFLPTRALTDSGIDETQLSEVTETEFYRSGTEELFQPPLILFREHESLPMAFWGRCTLAFKDKIVGIHASPRDKDELKELYDFLLLNRARLRFAVALNGSQALVGKATALLKNDLESLPVPREQSELDFAFWEQALADDTLEFMGEYVRLGQNSALLKETATTEAVDAYSKLFCRMLGSIYDNLHAADPVFLDGLICQPFYFGNEPSVEWLGPNCEQHLQQLVFDTAIDSLRTIRVVRIYQENVIFIIKPDRLRYWIRSTAVHDADDTLLELQQQGF